LTPLFFLTVPNFAVFSQLVDRKFNKDSKNVLKTVIFSLQMGFTDNFVPDYPFQPFPTVFLTDQTLTPLFSLTIPNFVVFFQFIGQKI